MTSTSDHLCIYATKPLSKEAILEIESNIRLIGEVKSFYPKADNFTIDVYFTSPDNAQKANALINEPQTKFRYCEISSKIIDTDAVVKQKRQLAHINDTCHGFSDAQKRNIIVAFKDFCRMHREDAVATLHMYPALALGLTIVMDDVRDGAAR